MVSGTTGSDSDCVDVGVGMGSLRVGDCVCSGSGDLVGKLAVGSGDGSGVGVGSGWEGAGLGEGSEVGWAMGSGVGCGCGCGSVTADPDAGDSELCV